jgi:hypothetical protein
MTVIALALDTHFPGEGIAAAIAARLGVDLVDRTLLLGLVAECARLDLGAVARLIDVLGRPKAAAPVSAPTSKPNECQSHGTVRKRTSGPVCC